MSHLSLQHQLLGEKCGFLTERFSLLHQAWEVSGSSGAFDACVRREGEFVMKRGPEGLVPLTLPTGQDSEQNASTSEIRCPRGKTQYCQRRSNRRGLSVPAPDDYQEDLGSSNKDVQGTQAHGEVGCAPSCAPHSSQSDRLTALTITSRNGSLT